jgi:complex III assembly factor LYRM7
MNTLFAARAEARRNFESNRHLTAGSDELSKQITHAEEVAKFLRENVVQGQAADNEGNYSLCLSIMTNQASWLISYRTTDT